MEVEGELPDRNAEEMAQEGFYLVKSVLRHSSGKGWELKRPPGSPSQERSGTLASNTKARD